MARAPQLRLRMAHVAVRSLAILRRRLTPPACRRPPQAQISYKGKTRYLGTFQNEETAARAYGARSRPASRSACAALRSFFR